MPATGPKGISNARLKAALRKTAGVYTLAAKELGCDRTNIAQRVARSPDLQLFVASIISEIEDLADSVIIDAMSDKTPGTGKPTKEARIMARWFKGHAMRMQGLQLRIQHLDQDGLPTTAPPVNVQIVYVDAPPSDEPDDEEIPA